MVTTTIITITTTIMTINTTDPNTALLRLMAWLSPVFPVGSFSYSHGLERAVHDGLVGNASELEVWLKWLLTHGSAWNDAILCAQSWRCAFEGRDIAEIAQLAEALAASKERHMETMLMGSAFVSAAKSWGGPIFERLPEPCAYPVAVGAMAGAHGVALSATLAAFLQAFCINLLQVSIRLSVTGQKGVTAIMAALEPVIAQTAIRAEKAEPDDLGSATFLSDIMAMKHETQHSRLFRA